MMLFIVAWCFLDVDHKVRGFREMGAVKCGEALLTIIISSKPNQRRVGDGAMHRLWRALNPVLMSFC